MQVRTLPVLGVAIALLAAVTAWAQQPTLAEVARKEAERRKTVKATTRVYTNEDVKRGLPLTTAAAMPAATTPDAASPKPPTGEAAAGEKAPADTASADDAGARDEAWWRQRMTELRDQMNRSRLFADALQSRVNALWADFTARDDPAQRATIERDRSEALAELERVKSEIERHQQAIADLEEDARKAGVPAGWLR